MHFAIMVVLEGIQIAVLLAVLGFVWNLLYVRVAVEQFDKRLTVELSQIREMTLREGKQAREELAHILQGFHETLSHFMKDIASIQSHQQEVVFAKLEAMTKMIDEKMELVRTTLDTHLRTLQEDNAKKLEQMRVTVDEKLQGTLEKRLGESFKLVSDRLEMVHKGLGEMQTLAAGVGDLKKVLSNVKTRGIWGEVQLGNLLEQLLTQEQYAVNVATRPGSQDRVEFAIKLPGKNPDMTQIWLPIDAKFPQETYERLLISRQCRSRFG